MATKISSIEKDDCGNIIIKDGNNVQSFRLIGYSDYSLTLFNENGRRIVSLKDVGDPRFFTAQSLIDYFKDCLCNTSINQIEKEDNEVFTLCKDFVKVMFKLCTSSDGTESYEGSDGSSFSSFSEIFAAGYEVECIKKAECTEMKFTLNEGETATYASLLAYFEANGTFDDASKGAEGINSIQYANLNKGGFTHTYNGNTETNVASFNFGSANDLNPISTDLSITSNKGQTQITYTLYKCL